MDFSLIFDGKARLDDMYDLGRLGYQFYINDGRIWKIVTPCGRSYQYGRA